MSTLKVGFRYHLKKSRHASPSFLVLCAFIMARKKDDIEAGILQKGVSAVRTDGPPIGRPVLCALGRGALMRKGRKLALL